MNAAKILLAVKTLFRKMGFDVIRFDPARYLVLRRQLLFDKYGTSLVLDVGANTGQYASQIRRFGYRGRIVSFEPMRQAFDLLQATASNDPDWDTECFALGETASESTIHNSANSISSSIRAMKESHLQASPGSKYLSTERISIRTLDSEFARWLRDADKVWMKIDTQGYEKNVLDGSQQILPKIDAIEIELSLVELYEGQSLLPDLVAYLKDKGFSLVALYPGFENKQTGELLQVDGIFHRVPRSSN